MRQEWLALGGADLDERAEEVVAEVAPGVALDARPPGFRGTGGPGGAGLALLRATTTAARRTDQRPDLAGPTSSSAS